MTDLVLMAVVGRPHGVRGLVRVQSYTADPDALSRYGALRDEQGRAWQLRWKAEGVAELRDAAGQMIADRDAAARLTNLKLYVARDQLPVPDEDEFYLADLVGMEAVDMQGQPVGRVAQVHDYGGGASLEIARPTGAALLVPFTRAAVPVVDLPTRRVTIDPPAEVVVETPAGETQDDPT